MATFSEFEKFYNEVAGLSKVYTVGELLLSAPDEFVTLKHDVECKVKKAYKLCLIEKSAGLRGTYYVQRELLKDKKNIEYLKKMQALGAEICYHHEVMDEADGDIDRACEIFEKSLSEFKKEGFCLSSVCQHGNPTRSGAGYSSNRDFLRDERVKRKFESVVDIMVNASEKIGTYTYISDHGYSWKIIPEPETDDKEGKKEHIALSGFEGISEVVNNDKRVIISIHTHRIASCAFTYFLSLVRFKVLRATARLLMRVPFLKKRLAGRYRLARKV